MASDFSIVRLQDENPGLADAFVWGRNQWAGIDIAGKNVHIGCGENVLPGFVNFDFIPSNDDVHACNLLDIWPDDLSGSIGGFYSEDVLEHFFLGEQLYILCSMNLLSPLGSVSRVLMPSIDKLWAYRQVFDYNVLLGQEDYFVSQMGCTDSIQVINQGMRMGGHRWLHNSDSFKRIAAVAGFTGQDSTCAQSVKSAFNGINIRTEGEIAFATDLIKTVDIKRLTVEPSNILNARKIEDIDENQALYKAETNDPAIVYEFPALSVDSLQLINIRCANISEFNEHNFSKIYFALDERYSMYTDRTLHSAHYMNTFSKYEIQRKCIDLDSIQLLRFDPGEHPDEFFTVGPIEIFYI